MGERAQVVGFTWVEGAVHLRQWKGSPPLLRNERVPEHICFRVLPGRTCTGYHDGHALRPCPERASLQRGTSCERCAARDAFRRCMTCDGLRCPKLRGDMLDYCRSTHHLYLACFGDTTLKVGTASDPRKEQRIIEQGPLAAARIAAAEGPTIKRMEKLLVDAGFSETMRRDRKTALLQAQMSEPFARDLVELAASALPDMLPKRYLRLLHSPQFVELPPLAKRSRSLRGSPLSLEVDRVVEGKLTGAIGHLLFVEDRDGCFTLDLGELKGLEIEWDPAGDRRRAAAQLALF